MAVIALHPAALLSFLVLKSGVSMESSNGHKDKMNLPKVLATFELNEDPDVFNPPTSRFKTQLVVHFDINETVLVGDEAGGDTRDESINKIIAKSSYVRMVDRAQDTPSQKPTHWWDGTEIASASSSSDPPPLYTGWRIPPNCCSYYVTSFKKRCHAFTETEHGKCYRPMYELLQDKVAFRHPQDGLPEIFSHMIPAFFHSLKVLTERQQPCRIVFRTFGSDLPEVAEAVTAFAKGLHPDFKVIAPSLVLTPSNLFRGRWSAGGKSYELWSYEESELLASGDEAILEFLKDKPVCGIQDHYEYWAANGMAPPAGKPVWVPRDTSEHHILLDDNIHNSEKRGIASVRRQDRSGSFRTLTPKEILEEHGRHLIRVPAVQPILNPNWFVEQIDKAQERIQRTDDPHPQTSFL